MKEFYKLYIGAYCENGNPATWTIAGVFPRQGLKDNVKVFVSQIKQGSDLYIVTPKGEIKAYFRDKLSQFFA